jgi:hypothetical protein
VAASSRKFCEATEADAAGVVFLLFSIGKPPRPRYQWMLRDIFLLARPPLLAVMQGEYRSPENRSRLVPALIVVDSEFCNALFEEGSLRPSRVFSRFFQFVHIFIRPRYSLKKPLAPHMTDDEIEKYLDLLREKGWKIELTQNNGLDLIESFRRRYLRIPEDYSQFLRRVAHCSNASETVWFLCAGDYNGTSDSAFAWNEFELLDLESAKGDDHTARQIGEFWERVRLHMAALNGNFGEAVLRDYV